MAHEAPKRKSENALNGDTFLTDIFLDAMDRRQVSTVVMLDLSKAFDSLEHILLIMKLRLLVRLSKITLVWFRGYLTDRTQSVRIDCDLSGRTR